MPIVLFLAVLAAAVALWPLWGRRGPWQALAFTIVLLGVTSVTTLTILGRPALSPSGPTPEPVVRPAESPSPIASPTMRVGLAAPRETMADRFVRYEVSVHEGEYRLFLVNAEGRIIDSRLTSFGGGSHAPVDRTAAANGLIHWRTIVGRLAGWSYIAGDSGPFTIRGVYVGPDDEPIYREVRASDR